MVLVPNMVRDVVVALGTAATKFDRASDAKPVLDRLSAWGGAMRDAYCLHKKGSYFLSRLLSLEGYVARYLHSGLPGGRCSAVSVQHS